MITSKCRTNTFFLYTYFKFEISFPHILSQLLLVDVFQIPNQKPPPPPHHLETKIFTNPVIYLHQTIEENIDSSFQNSSRHRQVGKTARINTRLVENRPKCPLPHVVTYIRPNNQQLHSLPTSQTIRKCPSDFAASMKILTLFLLALALRASAGESDFCHPREISGSGCRWSQFRNTGTFIAFGVACW